MVGARILPRLYTLPHKKNGVELTSAVVPERYDRVMIALQSYQTMSMEERGISRWTTSIFDWIIEGVGKHARVATAAVASSKITTRNQVARGRTSLVTRSLWRSNRGSEYPGIHIDNRAPGGLSMVGCTKRGVLERGKKAPKMSAFNTPRVVLRFIL